MSIRKDENFLLTALPNVTHIRFCFFFLTTLLFAWYLGTLFQWFFWDPEHHTLATSVETGLTGVIVLLVTATSLYYAEPYLIRRRHDLRELINTDDKILTIRLDSLFSTLNSRPHTVFLGSSFRRASAQIFGRPSRPLLRIDNGMRLILRKDQRHFDAIIRHEMGHVFHNDLLFSYYARALYITLIIASSILLCYTSLSFLMTAFSQTKEYILLGGTLNEVFFWYTPSFLQRALGFAGLWILLTFEYAHLMRVREYYADHYAASHGSRDTLIAILADNHVVSWPNIFSLHPTVKSRLNFIRQPSVMLKLNLIDAFLAGCVVALLLYSNINLLSDVGADPLNDVVNNISSTDDGIGSFIIAMSESKFFVVNVMVSLLFSFVCLSTTAISFIRSAIYMYTYRTFWSSVLALIFYSIIFGFGTIVGSISWPTNFLNWQIGPLSISMGNSAVVYNEFVGYLQSASLLACTVFFSGLSAYILVPFMMWRYGHSRIHKVRWVWLIVVVLYLGLQSAGSFFLVLISEIPDEGNIFAINIASVAAVLLGSMIFILLRGWYLRRQ